MKTLKKTLCLVLAVVMVVGVLIIPANAAEIEDYPDVDEIKNKEAVAVLTGIGIMTGDEDGFRPTDPLTRSEAAKLVAVASLGVAKANMLPKGTSVFPDVKTGDWYTGYLTYANKVGAITGFDDGTFKPDDHLTGYEFGKMLLKAIGSGKTYTGDTWESDVAMDALDNGLLADLPADIDLSKELNRDNAAQMLWNAMNAQLIDNSTGMTVTVGPDGTVTFTEGKESTVKTGDNLYKTVHTGKTVVGIVTANQATGAESTKIAAITFGEDGAISDIAASGTEYDLVTDLDMVGQVVTVYYATSGAAGRAFTAIQESASVTVSEPITAKEGSTKSVKDKLGNNVTKLTDTLAAKSWTFDASYTPTQGDISGLTIGESTNDGVAGAGTYVIYGGKVVAFIAPTTGVKVLSYVSAYTAPKSAAEAGSITLVGVDKDGKFNATETPITLNDDATKNPVVLYDGIDTGDWVYATKLGENKMTVEPATVLEAAVITETDNAVTTVTIAETSYKVYGDSSSGNSNTAGDEKITELGGLVKPEASHLGKLLNVVLTSDGKSVYGVTEYKPEDTTKADTYAVVQAVSVNGKKGDKGATTGWDGQTPATEYEEAWAKVMLILSDGTSSIFDVELTAEQKDKEKTALEEDLKMGTGKDIHEGVVVKYGLNASGEIAKIEKVTTVNSAEAKAKVNDDDQAGQGGILTVGSALVGNKAAEAKATAVTPLADVYLTKATVFIYWDASVKSTKADSVTRYVGYDNLKPVEFKNIKVVTDATTKEAILVYVDADGAGKVTTDTLMAYRFADTYVAKWDGSTNKPLYVYTMYVDGVKTDFVATEILGSTSDAIGVVTYSLKDGYLNSITKESKLSKEATISYVGDGIAVTSDNKELDVSSAKAYNVALDGTVSAGTVVASAAEKQKTIIIFASETEKTAGAGEVVAIYYVAQDA